MVVLNRSKQKSESPLLEAVSEDFLSLKTCLREMYILTQTEHKSFKEKNPELYQAFKSYKGFDAVEYLTKVLAGLESPVLGETEVFGQFKNQVLPVAHTKKELFPALQFTINIVKVIRNRHLVGSGSQSYGSLVRRLVKGESHVLFLGAGILAESIYPWVKSSKNVMFALRSKDKFKQSEMHQDNPWIQTYSLSEDFRFDFPVSVVVCAPLSSEQIQDYLKNTNVNLVIDLREESRQDPLELNARVYDLENVFNEMKSSQEKKELIKQISSDIVEEIDAKFVKHRPFGWDDLCL